MKNEESSSSFILHPFFLSAFVVLLSASASGNPTLKTKTKTSSGRVKSVALPIEHGGWGFLLEPIVLALLLAPSLAGVCLAIASLGVFLARHPSKLAIGDWRHRRTLPRTDLAKLFVVLYGTLALLGLLAALKTAQQGFLTPILLAAPLAFVQVVYDGLGRSRHLLPELVGSTAIAAAAASIVLAGGWVLLTALGLWFLLVARIIPTILYVRTRLRRIKGKRASQVPAVVAHLVATASVAILAWFDVVPFLAVAVMVVLLLRSLTGFSKYDKAIAARIIGIRELGFGTMTVIAIAIGYAMEW